MEVKGECYHVIYDPATATVTFQGSLMLSGPSDYEPIEQLLDKVMLQAPTTITLDIRPLVYLNSSGINILSRFVLKMRARLESKLVMLGQSSVPWQSKSLLNMQRLMPRLRLELV
jgi:hypothetical protein